MVTLFADIFVGTIHKESTPEMNVSPTDYFACLRYQIGELQNLLTTLIDITSQVANALLPSPDQEKAAQMSIPKEIPPSGVLPVITWQDVQLLHWQGNLRRYSLVPKSMDVIFPVLL